MCQSCHKNDDMSSNYEFYEIYKKKTTESLIWCSVIEFRYFYPIYLPNADQCSWPRAALVWVLVILPAFSNQSRCGGVRNRDLIAVNQTP